MRLPARTRRLRRQCGPRVAFRQRGKTKNRTTAAAGAAPFDATFFWIWNYDYVDCH
ncbi:hypothethical protein [Ralstonia solanacearum PSI07]|uniref:Hypothethical protein n=2 Tax=Ralstonia syzygii TaxID=28097 RepID=G3A7J7_9RALS|nr:hypothethical protein [Ralstonia solanacearum PSI07]CCA79885.1 conserved hypothetical protein [blood disease bacterium R229]CCA86473.1 hypothethical protein [Ralstonia syzygii R24]